MKAHPISALNEKDIDEIIDCSGGSRAHEDADQRAEVGADYVLGDTVIELKMLDEEGLDKPERQERIGGLFRDSQPNRPVVILDERFLSDAGIRKYRNAVERPITRAISKAKKQLRQTRSEKDQTKRSIVWIFNNGYSSLDHQSLVNLVANRMKSGSEGLDGVIVSGCYYHSDGFDSVLLWPFEFVAALGEEEFPEFELLQKHFAAFSTQFMTEFLQGHGQSGSKLEVRDIIFERAGIRYVRPAPTLGTASEFYVQGRPREGSATAYDFAPVAYVLPKLSPSSLSEFASVAERAEQATSSWEAWQSYCSEARLAASPTKAFVLTPVDLGSWLDWCRGRSNELSLSSLNAFALEAFSATMLSVLQNAQELESARVRPSSYVWAKTQEIGQSLANDVSDLALVRQVGASDPIVQPLAENLRIHHEHAMALGAAHALALGIECVLWSKDRRYCWA